MSKSVYSPVVSHKMTQRVEMPVSIVETREGP